MADLMIQAAGHDFSPICSTDFFRIVILETASEKAERLGRLLKTDTETAAELKREILTSFAIQYKEKQGYDLLFQANSTWFGRYAGVVRDKNFRYRCKGYGNLSGEEIPIDLTLQLGCRFDNSNKAFFLAAMLLELLGEDKENQVFLKDHVAAGNQEIFDLLLLFQFRNQLRDAMQKGIFRTYRRICGNSPHPHGAVDLPRHILKNQVLENGKIAYHSRELTADNPMNHLILAAFHQLKQKFSGMDGIWPGSREVTQQMVKLARAAGNSKENWNSEKSTRGILSANLRPITHPYFLEYENLRKTCLKILRGENISIFDADCCGGTESLLVDVARLWEVFLEHKIRQNVVFQSSGLQLKAQDQEPLCPEMLDFKARPDFVFYREGRPYAVLDAKWKPHWNDAFEKSKCEFLGEDINKCIRDMEVFLTSHTGVVFPCREADLCAPEGKLHKCGRCSSLPGAHKFFHMTRMVIPGIDTDFKTWHGLLEENLNQSITAFIMTLTEQKTS